MPRYVLNGCATHRMFFGSNRDFQAGAEETTHDLTEPGAKVTEPTPSKPKHPPRRLSDLILESTASGPNFMTVGELMEKLSAQGLAPVILFFGVLNTMAVIPGSSAITGFPVILMGLAVMFGYKGIWLPVRARSYMFDRAKLHVGVERAVPWLKKIEKYVHPRLWPVYGFIPDFLYGLAVVILAIIITLPIPGANLVPAIGIILLSIGFASRDGAWVLAGLFITTLALGIVIGAAAAALAGAGSLFSHL
ncbi:MAG: exopolysaccharide biosynthesis protein [Deltaproteobacteria bacterium]